ncbi:MAG TPA: four-carbon acid sugar kinase family protein [Terracidiphilus sp.]|nr:four-carbon acid sugar kinase family protein [Terracidiphilus sp.]
MKAGGKSGLLYAYYGDDFTGSTDVLEALALQGVPAVLFIGLPDELGLKRFADCRAIGIAGESRSRNPQWMNRNLPGIFAAMRALGAHFNHYKVCSTFDSSPRIGSIGRAMELGIKAFGARFVPVVVGAPRLGRAVVYGNLFASAHGVMHRIDRHPSMRHHPTTPMAEADLRLHLQRQTRMPAGLVDLSSFQTGKTEERLQAELKSGAKAIVFDAIDDGMLEETARLVYQYPAGGRVFAVGSSGLTTGLLLHWRRLQCIPEPPSLEPPPAADRIIVLSGSCSPVTARQIRRARQQGFAAFRLHGSQPWQAEMSRALEALSRGKSVVLYTALGPQPPDGNGKYGQAFGAALGAGLREMLMLSGARRAVIAGGDTSTRVVKQLGLKALTFAAPLAPGGPLCRAHAPGSPLDGLEIVLKGGQVGADDFFAQVRDGR